MRNFFLLLLLSASAFAWTGCSIEKRHYQKGFHVEWHNHKERAVVKDAGPSMSAEKIPETDSLPASHGELAILDERVDASQQEPDIKTHQNRKIRNEAGHRRLKERFTERGQRILEGRIGVDTPPNNPEPVVNKSAQRSMNYGLAAWALVLLLVLLNSVEVAPIVATMMFVGSLVCAILAIIHGNWARKELLLEPNPELNKRKVAIGLVLGWTYIVLLIASVLLTLLILIFLLSLLG